MLMAFMVILFPTTCSANSAFNPRLNMKKKLLLPFCIILMQITAFSQTPQHIDTSAKMQWFKDAKLGIFIHWGIYSVNGVDESWGFFNRKLSYADYMKQIKGFTASHYNP